MRMASWAIAGLNSATIKKQRSFTIVNWNCNRTLLQLASDSVTYYYSKVILKEHGLFIEATPGLTMASVKLNKSPRRSNSLPETSTQQKNCTPTSFEKMLMAVALS